MGTRGRQPPTITEGAARRTATPATDERIIFCAIYRTDAGLQLRAGHSVDDVVRIETVRSLNAARGLAAGWRHALIGAGFIELPREA